jgi:nitronate monooxygenase
MNTLLCKIGVSLPIIQAPMAGVSTPAMAAAVSNAGGLGSIGVGVTDAERNGPTPPPRPAKCD